MAWLIGIPVFLFVWTVVGVLWFFRHLGDKYREERWYEGVLLAPALVICCGIGWLYSKVD